MKAEKYCPEKAAVKHGGKARLLHNIHNFSSIPTHAPNSNLYASALLRNIGQSGGVNLSASERRQRNDRQGLESKDSWLVIAEEICVQLQ